MTSCHENYDLLNKSALCDQNNTTYRSELNYIPLREDIANAVTSLKNSKRVSDISVFFRDLKSGPRIGVQDSVTYDAASLMKVPALIAILHLADIYPGFLDQRLTAPASFPPGMSNTDQPNETIQPNTSYTIHELLEKMIKYSDNLSAGMLSDEVINNPQYNEVQHTFQDLGMIRTLNGKIGELSMQSYAILFASLYNTWYLSDAMSQYALQLLSQTNFTSGIVAGIPENVRVAHKFGTFQTDNKSELHDCGIVYHPITPYVLCILTNGSDPSDEATAIASISHIVYADVDAMRSRQIAH